MSGKIALDDHMKAHYHTVGKAEHKVNANKPAPAHYDRLEMQKKYPKFKPSGFDKFMREKHDKAFFEGMRNAKSQTDSGAPEHAMLYSKKRRQYRRVVTTSNTYKVSAGHEVQWSKTEEQNALGLLSKHARARSVSKGWTDSGPPIQAMKLREFRRSFKKPAMLDIRPPTDFHWHKGNPKSPRSQSCQPGGLVPLTPLAGSGLPLRRGSVNTIKPVENSNSAADPVGKRKVPKTAAEGYSSASQLFSRPTTEAPVETKRVWMPGNQSFDYKEIAVKAGKGQAGGLIGHGQRADHGPEHPKITPRRDPLPYQLPKAGTSPLSPLPKNTENRHLDSRELLPGRRETSSRKQMIHPRRVGSPEAPRSRQTTPTTFDLQVQNLDAECRPKHESGLFELKEEEEDDDEGYLSQEFEEETIDVESS